MKKLSKIENVRKVGVATTALLFLLSVSGPALAGGLVFGPTGGQLEEEEEDVTPLPIVIELPKVVQELLGLGPFGIDDDGLLDEICLDCGTGTDPVTPGDPASTIGTGRSNSQQFSQVR